MIFREQFSKTSSPRAATLENRGFVLEDSYRQFLESVNGGVLFDNEILIPELHESVPVHVLYGIGVQTTCDILTWLKEFAGDLPPRFVPIGSDPGGNDFLLRADSVVACPIYYWDYSWSYPGSDEGKNTYFVADSFRQFLSQLELSMIP